MAIINKTKIFNERWNILYFVILSVGLKDKKKNYFVQLIIRGMKRREYIGSNFT